MLIAGIFHLFFFLLVISVCFGRKATYASQVFMFRAVFCVTQDIVRHSAEHADRYRSGFIREVFTMIRPTVMLINNFYVKFFSFSPRPKVLDYVACCQESRSAGRVVSQRFIASVLPFMTSWNHQRFYSSCSQFQLFDNYE